MSTDLSLAIFFSILAAVLFVVYGFMQFAKSIWPDRTQWYASSSYEEVTPENNPQKAIDKDRRKQWHSSLVQEQGAWFEVDMGKLRTIASIAFTPDDSWAETPSKWRISFWGEQHRMLGHHKDGSGPIIEAKGKEIPKQIQSFRVEIQEPAPDVPANSNYAKRNDDVKVYWTISSIKVSEYRFTIFGKGYAKHEL